MVRPLQGERPKKTTTICIDPVVWQTFQDVVKEKEPDGDTSASSHVETLVKREIAKLTGQDVDADVATESHLQRRLNTLIQKCTANAALLKEGGGANLTGRLTKLANSYGLDRERWSNVKEVMKKILIDIERPNSPAQKYLNGETEANLFIENSQLQADIATVNAALMETRRRQAGVTPEEVKEAQSQPAVDEEAAEEQAKRDRIREMMDYNRRNAARRDRLLFGETPDDQDEESPEVEEEAEEARANQTQTLLEETPGETTTEEDQEEEDDTGYPEDSEEEETDWTEEEQEEEW